MSPQAKRAGPCQRGYASATQSMLDRLDAADSQGRGDREGAPSERDRGVEGRSAHDIRCGAQVSRQHPSCENARRATLPPYWYVELSRHRVGRLRPSERLIRPYSQMVGSATATTHCLVSAKVEFSHGGPRLARFRRDGENAALFAEGW